MFRSLEYHVLISTSTGYHLEGHPEVTIDRWQGGPGNRACRGWEIRFKGTRPSMYECRETTLENVDTLLLRFGDCEDCGAFSFRHGLGRTHCQRCYSRHEEMVRGYRCAADAVARVERAWNLAESIRSAPSIEAAVALIAS